MIARLSRVIYPVMTLGPGYRLGVWMQGCTIGCAGCMSLDTWDPAAGVPSDVETIVREFAAAVSANELPVNGLTLSGGEPFQQPDAVVQLVTCFRESFPGSDVLAFSGLRPDVLREQYGPILDLIDAVVAGPFVRQLAIDDHWRGSSNQTLLARRTAGGEALRAWTEHAQGGQVQLGLNERELWTIGVTPTHVLRSVAAKLAERGLTLGDRQP